MTQIEKATLPRSKSVVRARTQVQIQKVRAPFSLRCGAILIDYIVLAAILAISTLFARSAGGGARTAGNSTETVGLVIAFIVALVNFGIIPGLTGQTIGKWAAGLRIERPDGRGIGIGRAFLRHFVGYPLSALFLGLGFLIAVILPRGRTFQDLIANTVVVRDELVETDA